MAIQSIVFGASSPTPRFVYIVTDDLISTVTSPGYYMESPSSSYTFLPTDIAFIVTVSPSPGLNIQVTNPYSVVVTGNVVTFTEIGAGGSSGVITLAGTDGIIASSATGNVILSLGTITSATWNGAVIGTTYGGTGLAAGFTTNGVFYATGATAMTQTVAINTAGQVAGFNNATNTVGPVVLSAGTNMTIDSTTTHGTLIFNATGGGGGGVTSFQGTHGITPTTATTGVVTASLPFTLAGSNASSTLTFNDTNAHGLILSTASASAAVTLTASTTSTSGSPSILLYDKSTTGLGWELDNNGATHALTATLPDSASAYTLFGNNATTAYQVVTTDTNNHALGLGLTNVQIVTGTTGSAGAGLQAATLTAGANVTITPGAGTITIASSGGGGGGGLTTATLTLTYAQMLALNTTPILILAAPGAGLGNFIVNVVYRGKFAAANYTNGTISINYGTSNSTMYWGNAGCDLNQGYCVGFNAVSNTNKYSLPFASTQANVINAPIYAVATGGAISGGTAGDTFVITVFYYQE